MNNDDLYIQDVNNWSKYGGDFCCPNCLKRPKYLERWPHKNEFYDKWIIRFKCDCGLVDDKEKLLTKEETINRKRSSLIEKMLNESSM